MTGARRDSEEFTTRSNILDYQQEQHNGVDHHNNYNILHGAGRALSPEEKEAIREAYLDNIGTMTGAAAKVIEKAFQEGVSAADIVTAIEETGLAPRPSGYYLKKILDTWIETGVTVSRIRGECHPNDSVKWWRKNGR